MQHDIAIQLDLSPDNLARQLGSQFQASASIPLTIVTGVMGALGSLALMLLLSVFFLVGGPQLAEQLAQLFGALGGGQVGGFWGAIFGIPVLAALLTCLEHFRSRWAD